MRLYILPVLLLLSTIAQAQWIHHDLLAKPTLDTTYNNKFSFQAEVIGFFKNNEYATPLVKGETFPGMRFTPKFGYQLEDKFRFEIGSSGLYYSGDQKSFGRRLFNSVHLRMQYDIQPNLHFVLGNYYGGVNHRLVEPLYRWERHFIDAPESGIQIMYEDKKYFFDAWLNWQRFIEHGDPLQEVLTFGVSTSMKLTNPDTRFSASIPLQLVINHKGGQIDTSSKRNMVIGNVATGIQMKYALDHKFFNAVGLDLLAMGYYDNVPIKEVRPYDSGWGLYPVASVEAKGFKFMTGYWHAKKFYSVEGEPLFASFNHLFPDEKLPTRNVLTNKLSYTHQLHQALSIGAQAEVYTDLDSKSADYSFGVHIRFNLPGVKWKW